MIRMFSWIAPVVALAFVFSSSVRAADAVPAADAGTIKVTVNDKDGKPVADANVRVMKPMVRPAQKAPAGAALQAAVAADEKAPAQRPERPAPVATGKTGEDGVATLENVPAGEYMVAANKKDVGVGMAKVTVEAGKTAEVTIKLGEMKRIRDNAQPKN